MSDQDRRHDGEKMEQVTSGDRGMRVEFMPGWDDPATESEIEAAKRRWPQIGDRGVVEE